MVSRRRWSFGRSASIVQGFLAFLFVGGAIVAQQEPAAGSRDAVAAVERELELSVAAAQRGELEAARAGCRQALELAKLRGASQEHLAAMAPVLRRLGDHADRLGDQRTALLALRAVLQHREATVPETDLALQALRNDVANAMHVLGDLRGALDLKRRALDVYTAQLADDAVDLQMVRGSLASTLMAIGDLDGALALHEKILAVFTKSHADDHAYVQAARTGLASNLSELGREQEALALFQKALAVRERTLPPDDPGLQVTRVEYATSLASLGDVAAALEQLRKVVDSYARTLPPDHPNLLVVRGNLANCLRRLGDLAGARAIHEEVLRLLTETLPPDHPGLQSSRSGLAAVLLDSGDPYGAFLLQQQVLEVLTKSLPEEHPEVIKARSNLAASMHQLGDWNGALVLQEGVLRAFAKRHAADHIDVCRARFNLAITLSSKGDKHGALALEREMLAGFEKALPADHPELLAARGSVACRLKELGRWEEALPLEKAAHEACAARLPADDPRLLTARMNYANTLRQVGQPDEALWLLDGVLRTRVRALPAGHPDLQLTYGNLALVHRDRGDFEKAAQTALEAATGALQFVGNRVLSLRVAPAQAMESARLLGLIAELLDEKVALPDALAAQLREVGLRLVVAADHVHLGAGESRRLLMARDPVAGARIEREFAVASQRLADAVVLPREGRVDGDGKVVSREDAIRDATLAKDAVEREWMQLVGPQLRVAPTIAEVAGRLAANEVAIAFCNYPEPLRGTDAGASAVGWRYGAFLLAKNGTIRWHDLGAEQPVTELVVQLRDAAEGRGPAADAAAEEKLLARLDAILLAPLRASLPAGTKRLVVSMARDLRLVPIDVLPTAAAFDCQLVWSLRSLLFERAGRRADAPLLVVGDVDYDAAPSVATPPAAGMATAFAGTSSAWRGRPGAAATEAAPSRFAPLANGEARAVAKLFGAALPKGKAKWLRGAEACEEAIAAEVRGVGWLHVATHGYFAPENAWSAHHVGRAALGRFASTDDRVSLLTPFSLTGLVLAGANRPADPLGRREGLLTAQEAAALDLSACYLVTLSACESSLGVRQAGDGLASLRAAFHSAGARFVVASLWNVSDRATETLMLDFYERLWRRGDSPAQALRAAKQAARERRAPLREWAGWVLTGR